MMLETYKVPRSAETGSRHLFIYKFNSLGAKCRENSGKMKMLQSNEVPRSAEAVLGTFSALVLKLKQQVSSSAEVPRSYTVKPPIESKKHILSLGTSALGPKPMYLIRNKCRDKCREWLSAPRHFLGTSYKSLIVRLWVRCSIVGVLGTCLGLI